MIRAAVVFFPEEFSRPFRESWQRQRGDGRRRSPVDRGPPRVNRRASFMPDAVQMTIEIDRNGKAIFDRFFDDETGGGIEQFVIIDPTTHGWGLATSDGLAFCTHDGTPILLARWWRARFGDRLPTETVLANSDLFRISFVLEVFAW